jgi:hypothetical protein
MPLVTGDTLKGIRYRIHLLFCNKAKSTVWFSKNKNITELIKHELHGAKRLLSLQISPTNHKSKIKKPRH